ncbi:hypothetical protein EOE18_15100 [Novosphingobium umbonatum]|uniref:Uncharacterized protein n=1 Tax=Novosphingobium umbonatum TaxID=1908524 RepID=A0A3S2VBL4_9SPHN|nr:hypothetical protein [Novosphingobium umbonatum]RVU03645.1 hypothetical protein EOE18_15100 [Novosphingobium umbonatum]
MLFTLLFHALGWLRWGRAVVASGFSWALGSAARIWAVVALCAMVVAIWQNHRSRDFQNIAQQTQSAFNAARLQAETTRRAAEARYRSLAHEADHTYAQGIAEGDARLAAYIAAHRLQPAAKADPARTAQDPSAQLSDIPPAETVLATMSDMKICDANYAYAAAAHEWAIRLNP